MDLPGTPRLPAPGERVVVAMSGGVDSSVAAALLVERGCDVVGVTLTLYEGKREVAGGCCTPEDLLDARRVANQLGIRHYLLNEREAFRKAVIAPFVDAYRTGRTPNPCVECNRTLKFDRLLHRVRQLDSRWLATGHYARLRGDPPSVFRAVDDMKDQTYFLHGMPAAALPFLTFPVGEFDKETVRHHAARLGLRTAGKAESQDVCFVPPGGLDAFLVAEGGAAGAGDIVDEQGAVLARHDGVHRFTVGQRRGLGVTSADPLYVQRIDAARRRLVVTDRDGLAEDTVEAAAFRWLRRPAEAEALSVKVRYGARPVGVRSWVQTGDRVRLELVEPVRAVAPGQSAVVYGGLDRSELLGGGTIDRAASPPARIPEDAATAAGVPAG